MEKVLGPDHPQVAIGLKNLGVLYDEQGKYAQAEPLYKRSVAIVEKVLGPEHPDVAQGLNNLAVFYDEQGKYAQAEPLYQRSLAIREKGLGPEHPDVAQSLNNLAALYDAQGKYAQAEPLFKRALAIREKVLGPEHPQVAIGLNNLALLYFNQGNYAEAEPLYQRRLAIDEKVLGPEHPSVATSLNNYAALLREVNREAEAEELEARARMILGRRWTFGFIRENWHWLWMLVLVPVFWWLWRTRTKRKKLYAQNKQSPELMSHHGPPSYAGWTATPTPKRWKPAPRPSVQSTAKKIRRSDAPPRPPPSDQVSGVDHPHDRAENLRFWHAIFVRLRQLKRNHLSGQTRRCFWHRHFNPMGRQIPIAPTVIQQAHSQKVAAGSRHYSS